MVDKFHLKIETSESDLSLPRMSHDSECLFKKIILAVQQRVAVI